MRKIFTLILVALACPLLTMGAPVTRQAARTTAEDFLKSQGRTMQESDAAFRAPRKAKAAEASYYVFSIAPGEGYVIVSGDDRTEAVLGYVPQGDFDIDSIPDAMRGLLEQYAEAINSLDANGVTTQDARRARAHRKVISYADIDLSSRVPNWNQYQPYNQSLPDYYDDNGNNAGKPVTGCVQTAAAEVMFTYRYPAATTAEIAAHSYTSGGGKVVSIPAIAAGTAIDWDNMLLNYSVYPYPTEAQNKAVADLMLYLGQAIKAAWGGSTGTAMGYLPGLLRDYFGYAGHSFHVGANEYASEHWKLLLYSELKAGFPVLYRGEDSGGGHAFVVEGYRNSDNQFYVNWGWGGYQNGWFVLEPAGGLNSYTIANAAIFNLRTPAEETTTWEITSGDQLVVLSDVVNRGGHADVNIKLMNDIDMSDYADWYTPLGTSGAPFVGTFDGQGHTIQNTGKALVGYTGDGAVIRNLTMEGDLAGQSATAFVVTHNSGTLTINGCTNKTTFNGTAVGCEAGFVGLTHDGQVEITNCQWGSGQAMTGHSYVNGYCSYCGMLQVQDGFFQIANAEQLVWFSDYVNTTDPAAKACLTADIDMSTVENFTPIGLFADDQSAGGQRIQFRGTFDGQGHEIRNLTINDTKKHEAALFSRATDEATIQNLGIVNATISGTNTAGRAGVLIGWMGQPTIKNVYATGNFTITNNGSAVSKKCLIADAWYSGKTINCWTVCDAIFGNKTSGQQNSYAAATQKQLTSGELCYKLNQGAGETIFYQTLRKDRYPVLDSTHKPVLLWNTTYVNPWKGDVNHDFAVSITDVGLMIDCILGSNPQNFDADAADMNDDGSVTITDVGLVIDLILSGGSIGSSIDITSDEEIDDSDRILAPQRRRNAVAEPD